MALETERTSRDYLYGRLLAIADRIEEHAIYIMGENRDSTSARLMQRFADRPYQTWLTIELSLTPYLSRLRTMEKEKGFFIKMSKLMDEVMSAFQVNDYKSNERLSGEFLLGFHCQRRALWQKNPDGKDGKENNSNGQQD